MRLAHIHLPRSIPYARSLQLQETLLEKYFTYNTQNLQSSRSPSTNPPTVLTQPQPTLLTFQADPVYTVGRRHLKSDPLSQAQIDFLTTNSASPTSKPSEKTTKLATFYPSPRGGLLTYHAPGQLTAYLIISLKAHGITPRCFIRLLENTVIRTCARHGVANTLTTDDPGVWIGERKLGTGKNGVVGERVCGGDLMLTATTRKICAIGVHVTRGITSHGVGLNVCDASIPPTDSHLYTLPEGQNDKPQAAPGYLSWGFNRIVACGLEGKSVTWLANEGAEDGVNPDAVAHSLAEEVCKSLSLQGKISISGIDRCSEEEVLLGTEQATSDEAG